MNAFASADGKMLYLQDKAIKYNDFMASMGQGQSHQTAGQSSSQSQQNFARFYEIPFREVLQRIAIYQIQEKAKKDREFFMQKQRNLKFASFENFY